MQEIIHFDKLKVLKSSMTIVFLISSLKIAKWCIFSAKFEVLSTYMKLSMNLNLRAEKQNYCLTSSMLLQSYFPFLVLINLFFQKKICISCVYYLLSQRFFYLMTVKLRKVRNNLLKEMNPKWDCIISKNTCFQQIFMGTEKESKEILRL